MDLSLPEIGTVIGVTFSAIALLFCFVYLLARLYYGGKPEVCPHCGYSAGSNFTFVILHGGRKICRYCRRAVLAEGVR